MRTLARLDAKEFASALKAIKPFASNDATRPVLCAVKVEIRPGRIRLLATDSYRLGIAEFKTGNKSTVDLYVSRADLVKAANAIKGDSEVVIGKAETESFIATRMLNGRVSLGIRNRVLAIPGAWGNSPWPDLAKVHRRRCQRVWRADFGCANGLIEILKDAAPARRPEKKRVTYVLSGFAAKPGTHDNIYGDCDCRLRVEWPTRYTNSVANQFTYAMLYPHVAGRPERVWFNRQYLLDTLAFMGGQPFTIYCHGVFKAMEFVTAGRSALLMPDRP